jgi:hypothetical protein
MHSCWYLPSDLSVPRQTGISGRRLKCMRRKSFNSVFAYRWKKLTQVTSPSSPLKISGQRRAKKCVGTGEPSGFAQCPSSQLCTLQESGVFVAIHLRDYSHAATSSLHVVKRQVSRTDET